MPKCKRCGAMITEKTTVCPQCGMNDPIQQQSKEKTAPKKAHRLRRTVWTTLAVLALLLIATEVIRDIQTRRALEQYGRELFGSVTDGAAGRTEQRAQPTAVSQQPGYRMLDTDVRTAKNYLHDASKEADILHIFPDTPFYEGWSYEIESIAEKHDDFQRYLFQIQYRASDGTKWNHRTGYIYLRYHPSRGTYSFSRQLCFAQEPDSAFFDDIQWGQDTPHEGDIEHYLAARDARSAGKTQSSLADIFVSAYTHGEYTFFFYDGACRITRVQGPTGQVFLHGADSDWADPEGNTWYYDTDGSIRMYGDWEEIIAAGNS